MVHVESEIPGISEELVERYGAEALRKLIQPRSEPQYAFEYDRSATHDGSFIVGPFSASRHGADHPKRTNWLAVRLMQEHLAGDRAPHGPRWREVTDLPATLRIAGAIA